MDEEQKEELVPNALGRVGLDKPLVKKWRIESPTVWVPSRTRSYTDKLKGPGLYLDPGSGIFYARVPETEEGTLYAAERLADLREEVREAFTAHVQAERGEDRDTRTWERRIRIHYNPETTTKRGPFITKTDSYGRRSWQQPMPPVTCVVVGAVTFSRYERALQPDGQRWDTREWAEDFEARLAAWKAADPRDTKSSRRVGLTQEDHRKSKPQRKLDTVWAGSRGLNHYAKPKYRDIPWDPEIWEQLQTFTQRFATLHSMLAKFLVEVSEEDFVNQLGQASQLLLSGPQE
jgi:hypothetical protein